MSTMTGGAARVTVNPPLGIKTAGFSSREGVVRAIESDLTATALVLESDGRRIAIIALDLCGMPLQVARDLRSWVAEAVATTPSRVLVNLSHTHSSPALPDTQPEFAYQRPLLEAYQAMLMERVVQSAVEAAAIMRPVRLGVGRGESRIGVQRRQLDEEGFIFLGEVPEGEIDSVVGVVRVDDLEGRAIATLASYGCHPVSVGPRSEVASPDFPGAMRDLVESAGGGLAFFLQGGGGDIAPLWGMGWEEDCRDSKDRLGRMLGAEVVRVATGLRTNVRRGDPIALPSHLAKGTSMRPWVAVNDELCTYLDAVSETVELDLLDLPSEPEALAIQRERHSELEEARTAASERLIAVTGRFAAWSDELVEAVRSRRSTTTMDIVAMRLNDIVITGISAEVFSSTTREIRARSPFPNTVPLGYTNGVRCYLPRAEDYPTGGWEVRERYRVPDLVFQAYLLPVGLAPTSESRVVGAVLGLIDQLR